MLANGVFAGAELALLTLRKTRLRDFVVRHEFEAIGPRTIRLNARTLEAPGAVRSILLSMEDVTATDEARRGGRGAPPT